MKIDPCPFCGSNDVQCSEHGTGNNQRDCVWVICFSCDAEGPPAAKEDDAITKWNTRVQPDKPVL